MGATSARAAPLALFLAGCAADASLTSDPGAWSPRRGALAIQDGAAPLPPGCDEPPAVDPSRERSRAGGPSHLPGQPCLEGCHEPGGTATRAFAAAGTVYREQGRRELASSGSVGGVGGTTLAVDACGNFWAVAGALEASANTTQPFVREPTFRKMERAMNRTADAGDCNRSGCHDFGSTLRSGIYF